MWSRRAGHPPVFRILPNVGLDSDERAFRADASAPTPVNGSHPPRPALSPVNRPPASFTKSALPRAVSFPGRLSFSSASPSSREPAFSRRVCPEQDSFRVDIRWPLPCVRLVHRILDSSAGSLVLQPQPGVPGSLSTVSETRPGAQAQHTAPCLMSRLPAFDPMGLSFSSERFYLVNT